MAQFSPQQQQAPQPETETEDFTLADSFINYDYVPDPDVIHSSFGSGCTRLEEVEPEAEAKGVANLGSLGLCGVLEEGIERISLVGGRDGDDHDKGHESSESESGDSSSSESDSDSYDDSVEEEDGHDGEKSELEEGEIVESDDDDDDDDGDVGGGSRSARRRTEPTNELEALPLVPPVNLTLEARHRMLPVGLVMSVLGTQVIVEGVEKHEPLNEGSILWMTESRKPLGLIDEIFGPVRNPYYVVRYNSENEVPKGIRGGTLISFVPEFASHVVNNKDCYEKGYDYDEEGSEDLEFSDDEKEAEYYRKQRMSKRGISNGQNHGKSKNKGKKHPPKEDVASAAPLHYQGNCSTFSGNGEGPFGSTTVAPAAQSHYQGNCSTFSGNGQGPFGSTTVAPAAPLHYQGNCSTFSGNGQGPFGSTTNTPAAPSHYQGNCSTFSGNGQGPFESTTLAPAAPSHYQGNCSTFSGIGQGPFGSTIVAPAAPSHYQGNCLTFSGIGQGPFGSTIVAPAAPLHDQGHSSTFSGNGQCPFGPTAVVPMFPPANTGLNLTASGIWTNGATLPQPQPAMLPNGFPTNGTPWFPENTQISHQLPVPGVPFQHHLNPNQVFPPATAFPPQLPYALGLAAQSQMAFGSSSPFPQVQPPICPGQQGFPLASSSIPFNHQAPNQFHPGASSNHGRKNFHPGGRKGWRPAK